MEDSELEFIPSRYFEHLNEIEDQLSDEDDLSEDVETLNDAVDFAKTYAELFTGEHPELNAAKEYDRKTELVLEQAGESIKNIYDDDRDFFDEAIRSFNAAITTVEIAYDPRFNGPNSPVQNAFDVDESLPDSYDEIMDNLGIEEYGDEILI
jgi:hypothetical protein